MNTQIAVTPESEALNQKIEACNKEYLDLYTLHRDMVDNESILLTSLYMEKLGYLQLELLEKQTEDSRLKMKIKLIQAAFNRDEKPDVDSINQELDNRLSDYYKEIAEQAELLEKSKKVLSSLLSEEDTLKLKELFRVLCKRLHPDLNPSLSDVEQDLFVKVKASYDLQRLSELQDILLYLDGIGEDKTELLSFNQKETQLNHLKKNIAVLKDKIDKLKNNFPFNIAALLQDEMLLAKQQNAIKEQIVKIDESIDSNQEVLNLMLSLIE